MGTDHTLFALTDGAVNYRTKANGRVYVSIMPKTAEAAE
jgi:large subunit ribosomal protein L27